MFTWNCSCSNICNKIWTVSFGVLRPLIVFTNDRVATVVSDDNFTRHFNFLTGGCCSNYSKQNDNLFIII